MCGFDTNETIKSLLEASTNPIKQYVIIKETQHLHQSDVIMISPITVYTMMGKLPCQWQFNNNELYKLTVQLPMRFLKKQSCGNFLAHYIEQQILPMEYRYVDYIYNYEQSDMQKIMKLKTADLENGKAGIRERRFSRQLSKINYTLESPTGMMNVQNILKN